MPDTLDRRQAIYPAVTLRLAEAILQQKVTLVMVMCLMKTAQKQDLWRLRKMLF